MSQSVLVYALLFMTLLAVFALGIWQRMRVRRSQERDPRAPRSPAQTANAIAESEQQRGGRL